MLKMEGIRFQSTKPSTRAASSTTKKSFNALSNKNLLINKREKPRVKIDYSSTLPRVPHSTYLSPLHIKIDSLYALHRPLLMSNLKDELLPLNNELFIQSRKDNPSTFHPSDEMEVREKLEKESIDQIIQTFKTLSNGRLINSKDEIKATVEIISLPDDNIRGWERTPFAVSAAGMRDFTEWDGNVVGKLIKAVDGKIFPYQKPKSNDRVKVVRNLPKKIEKEDELNLQNDKDFYKVEELISNPAQKSEIFKKTRGRLRPLPVVFKKKK